jgi:3-oxoacyl-[acyl-carrier protein] reductase
MQKLDCAIVTGAGQGIGKAIARDLGARDVHVVCVSKSINAEKTAAEIIKAGGSAETIITDIGDIDNTRARISDWTKRNEFKRMGLVLAASVLGPHGFQKIEEWDECYRVNVLGNLTVYMAVLPQLFENKFGRIVCFAGGGAAYAYPLFPAYAASKVAMARTVENIQEDLDGKGDFAAVCLAPGANETDMLKKVRAAGAKIKTTVDISEPVAFVREFLFCKNCGFKGALVHVRDNWREYLDGEKKTSENQWKLRRIER